MSELSALLDSPPPAEDMIAYYERQHKKREAKLKASEEKLQLGNTDAGVSTVSAENTPPSVVKLQKKSSTKSKRSPTLQAAQSKSLGVVEQKKELFKRKIQEEDFKVKRLSPVTSGSLRVSSKKGDHIDKDSDITEEERLAQFKQKLLQGESGSKKMKPVFARFLNVNPTSLEPQSEVKSPRTEAPLRLRVENPESPELQSELKKRFNSPLRRNVNPLSPEPQCYTKKSKQTESPFKLKRGPVDGGSEKLIEHSDPTNEELDKDPTTEQSISLDDSVNTQQNNSSLLGHENICPEEVSSPDVASLSSYRKSTSIVEVKEISVLQPKRGSLYPCLDQASVVIEPLSDDLLERYAPTPRIPQTTSFSSLDHSCVVIEPLSDELLTRYTSKMSPEPSTSRCSPVAPTSGTPDITLTPPKVTPMKPILRSVSEYRREQKAMRTPVKKSEEGITVILKNAKPENKQLQDKLNKVNKCLQIYQKQAIQTDHCVKSARDDPTFRNGIQSFVAQSANILVKEQIRLCSEEIKRLDIEKTACPKTQENMFVDEGSILIKSIDFQLDIDKLDHHSYQYFVFCLIYFRDMAVATPVVCLDYLRYNPDSKTFNIHKDFRIQDVDSDFNSKINIFALKVPKVTKIETPSKKMKLAPKSSRKKLSPNEPAQEFVLNAYAVFSIAQLNQKSFSISVTGSSALLPWGNNLPLHMNFEFIPKQTIEFQDFLTVYNKTGLSVFLRFCKLDSRALYVYKYPSDLESEIPPLREIQIKDITSKPLPAPTDMCIKPNAFYFTTREEDGSSRVNLFTCTNKKKLEQWISAINLYLSMVKTQ